MYNAVNTAITAARTRSTPFTPMSCPCRQRNILKLHGHGIVTVLWCRIPCFTVTDWLLLIPNIPMPQAYHSTIPGQFNHLPPPTSSRGSGGSNKTPAAAAAPRCAVLCKALVVEQEVAQHLEKVVCTVEI
ncbi:hypothetical protein C8R45DRAFT_928617 [Mycena sanguinolenta]|nr:hypothetical protein C8R45DRAFT_928617 [Mycena sanguinolenta]